MYLCDRNTTLYDTTVTPSHSRPTMASLFLQRLRPSCRSLMVAPSRFAKPAIGKHTLWTTKPALSNYTAIHSTQKNFSLLSSSFSTLSICAPRLSLLLPSPITSTTASKLSLQTRGMATKRVRTLESFLIVVDIQQQAACLICSIHSLLYLPAKTQTPLSFRKRFSWTFQELFSYSHPSCPQELAIRIS